MAFKRHSPTDATAGTPESTGRPQHASPLFPPLRCTPGDLLALPAGFSYEVAATSGQTEIHDGTGKIIGKTPERPDGTSCVEHKGRLRPIQNHVAKPGAAFPVPLVDGTVYDHRVLGGAARSSRRIARGTACPSGSAFPAPISNCAGGPSPWGTWLTCEETEAKAGTDTLEKDHGYVFEVFSEGTAEQSPLPIKAWGRAPHEAVVVEPSRERVYLTEDAGGPTGLLYRWSAQPGYRLRPYIALRPAQSDLVACFPYNEVLHTESANWETSLGASLDMAFDGPDGCHVSPYGSLILTEDGNTANHVLSWSREAGAQAIARNLIMLEQSALGGNVYSEMTGPNLSPDGSVLFVNVQEPGNVRAIRGPWHRYLG